MIRGKLRSTVDPQMSKNNAKKQFFWMQMQQKNIRGDNFFFPKYSVLISQTSVDTIGKLELIGKIVISQG